MSRIGPAILGNLGNRNQRDRAEAQKLASFSLLFLSLSLLYAEPHTFQYEGVVSGVDRLSSPSLLFSTPSQTAQKGKNGTKLSSLGGFFFVFPSSSPLSFHRFLVGLACRCACRSTWVARSARVHDTNGMMCEPLININRESGIGKETGWDIGTLEHWNIGTVAFNDDICMVFPLSGGVCCVRARAVRVLRYTGCQISISVTGFHDQEDRGEHPSG